MRVVVGSVIFLIGVVLIYAFGAGYLSGLGIGVPTPWNVVVALIFLGLLVWGVFKIAGFADRHQRRS